MDGRLIISNERVETPEKLVSENPATLEPARRGQPGLPGALRTGHRGGQGGLPGLALARSPGEARHLQAGREHPGPAGGRSRAAHRPGERLPLSRIPGRRGLRGPPVHQLLRAQPGAAAPAEAGRPPHPVVPQQVGRIPLPPARPDPHHLALELPLPHPLLRYPQRPDGGEHGRPEAVDVDAVHGPAHRRGLPRGRAAAGRPQRRRLQDAPGRGHDRRPRHPDGHVHRQRRHRQAHHGALQPEPDQPDPRARRQGPDDRPRGRRHRAGGARGRVGGLHELRPELRVGRAGLRRAEDRRGVHGPGPRAGRGGPGRRSAGRGRRHGPDGHGRAAQGRRGAHRRRQGQGRRSAARRRTGPGAGRGISSNRRSSPGSITPCCA